MPELHELAGTRRPVEFPWMQSACRYGFGNGGTNWTW